MTTVAVTNELKITLASEGQILAGQLTTGQSFDLAEELIRAGIRKAMEEEAEGYLESQSMLDQDSLQR